MKKFLIAAMILTALAPLSATAGSISGQVKDASGKPVHMATVAAGGQSDITDVNGKFRLKGLPDGAQKLTVKKDKTVKESEVTVGPNTAQDVTLP
ncbi:MAG: carboxypeptidase regulatory-like domain-containing protein [Nitrospinae bacterium]|nr:carboxypeptidase regulatory-like domain-containing protein [Nitrospinota bacterium]